MNWLRNFMIGRYGSDQLSWAMLGLYLVLSLFLPSNALRWLAMIPLGIFWYRLLSRDITRRTAENHLFLEKIEPIAQIFRKKNAQRQDREHRYFTCPGCRQTLRVPRGKGKISISCPKCGRTITKQS